MRKYRLIAKKGEGTFSEVLKAQNINDNSFHAIKCMKNHFDNIEQVNNLREIQALRRLSPHPHIIKLEEVLYDAPTGRLALVFELMEGNLYEFIRGRKHYLKSELIQSLMYQVVQSLEYMHSKGIFHRDIKPENILIDPNIWLKLADFGSCRGIYSKQPYTEYISTRWYRAPECLLTDGFYGPEMDLWGIGCVFFEITSLYPLFPGTNELDQIHRIHQILGTPSAEELEYFKKEGPAAHLDFNSFTQEQGVNLHKLIPHASKEAVDLMSKFLTYNPSKRINAKDALKHPYFKDLREAEALRGKLAAEAALAASVSKPQDVNVEKKEPMTKKPVQEPTPGLPALGSRKQLNVDPEIQKPVKTKVKALKETEIKMSSSDPHITIKPAEHSKEQNKDVSGLPPIRTVPDVQPRKSHTKKLDTKQNEDGSSKSHKTKHARRRHHK